MLRLHNRVKFGKRSGMIVGYTFCSVEGEPEPFYIIELDAESRGYLEPIGRKRAEGDFISMMLIHMDNLKGSNDVQTQND